MDDLQTMLILICQNTAGRLKFPFNFSNSLFCKYRYKRILHDHISLIICCTLKVHLLSTREDTGTIFSYVVSIVTLRNHLGPFFSKSMDSSEITHYRLWLWYMYAIIAVTCIRGHLKIPCHTCDLILRNLLQSSLIIGLPGYFLFEFVVHIHSIIIIESFTHYTQLLSYIFL